jgi:hypothetical protein
MILLDRNDWEEIARHHLGVLITLRHCGEDRIDDPRLSSGHISDKAQCQSSIGIDPAWVEHTRLSQRGIGQPTGQHSKKFQ